MQTSREAGLQPNSEKGEPSGGDGAAPPRSEGPAGRLQREGLSANLLSDRRTEL